MSTPSRRVARSIGLISALAATSTVLAACGSSSSKSASSTPVAATGAASASTAATTAVVVGGNAAQSKAGVPTTLNIPVVASIRAELPASVISSGKLVVGLGLLPSGSPPLGFVGDDKKTLTGSEPDLGRLVAAVFGLKPDIEDATWDNLFVGIDSGKTDVGFSNITDTEARKAKYDFASYRQDNLGFEVLKSSSWNFDGNFENLAGQTVAVDAGTNQEKILLQWQTQLKAEGKTLTVKYFPDINSTYLALDSGQITGYFTPNPSIAYHVSEDATSATPTRSAGKFSGAGATLQGLISATTKKGNGLDQPLADAINYLIKNGDYAKWLAAWNLSNEAVPTSQVNPPGLPLSNS
jgi:polar amino acid transport system substrate-binding protein